MLHPFLPRSKNMPCNFPPPRARRKARTRSGSKATKAGWLLFELAIGKDIFRTIFPLAISNRAPLGYVHNAECDSGRKSSWGPSSTGLLRGISPSTFVRRVDSGQVRPRSSEDLYSTCVPLHVPDTAGG